MEVNGVNRLLALANQIGVGSSRPVDRVSAREPGRPSSDAAPRPRNDASGLSVTLSAAARAKADSPASAARSNRSPSANATAAPELQADAGIRARRPAFSAYLRAESEVRTDSEVAPDRPRVRIRA